VNEHKFERRQLTEKAKTLRTMIQYRHLRNGAISAVNGCPAYHSTKPINEMPGRSATNLGSTSIHQYARYSKYSDKNQSSPAGDCAALGNEEEDIETKVESQKSEDNRDTNRLLVLQRKT
jgi:hypothetical protein